MAAARPSEMDVVASSSSFMSQHVPSNVEASQSAGERRVRLRLAFGGTFVAVSGWLRATDSLRGLAGALCVRHVVI